MSSPVVSFAQKQTELRKSQFKKTMDAEDGRRKREDLSVQIRKSKRDEDLLKRRKETKSLTVEESAKQQQDLQALQHNKAAVLQAIIQGINSPDPTTQEQSVERIRRMLSVDRNPPIQDIIDAGIIPTLVRFLGFNDRAKLQYEAAWALTNVLSGTSEQTLAVLNTPDALNMIFRLLSSPNEELREQAMWAIGNITGESPQLRDYVIEGKAIEAVLQCINFEELESVPITMLRVATWTLANMCRGKPAPAFNKVKVILPTLSHIIQSTDEDLLVDACWALSYLSDGDNDRIQSVLEAAVARRMTDLLLHRSLAVQTPALRTIGNLLTGDDHQTQVVVNVGALPNLAHLLHSTKKAIKKEACWAVSNVTAGNRDQIQSAIDSGVLEPMIELMKTAEFDVRKEASWAISNCTSNLIPDQIKYLVRKGAIEALVDLLDFNDTRVTSVCLEALENILKVGHKSLGVNNLYAHKIEECGGLDKIEELQSHANEEIYRRAMRMIEKYWAGEEDQNIAPVVNNSNTFAFGTTGPQTFAFH